MSFCVHPVVSTKSESSSSLAAVAPVAPVGWGTTGGGPCVCGMLPQLLSQGIACSAGLTYVLTSCEGMLSMVEVRSGGCCSTVLVVSLEITLPVAGVGGSCCPVAVFSVNLSKS